LVALDEQVKQVMLERDVHRKELMQPQLDRIDRMLEVDDAYKKRLDINAALEKLVESEEAINEAMGIRDEE
jgi:hypothetical protein